MAKIVLSCLLFSVCLKVQHYVVINVHSNEIQSTLDILKSDTSKYPVISKNVVLTNVQFLFQVQLLSAQTSDISK